MSRILSTGGGGGVWSGLNPGGVPAPNFRGGVVWSDPGGGACSKFWVGGACSKFPGGVPAPNFRGGVSNFRNTVNVRPVRILLECILVLNIIQ